MKLLYEGPSKLDGKPVVCLMTGLSRPSMNRKTGFDMVQVWYLRQDLSPTEAVKTREDYSICGDCPHRGTSCYVIPSQAPTAVWHAYRRGNAQPMTDLQLFAAIHHRKVRVGAYGDPSCVPYDVNHKLMSWSAGYTGYTQAWSRFPDYVGKLMASVSSEREAFIAQSLGWHTYRIKSGATAEMKGEYPCPSPAGVTCSSCMACNGSRGSRTIEIHGSQWKKIEFIKRQAA